MIEIPVVGVGVFFGEGNPVRMCCGCSSLMPWVETIFASAVVFISVELTKMTVKSMKGMHVCTYVQSLQK